MCLKQQLEFTLILQNLIMKVFVKLFLNDLFVSFNYMLDDYKKKKNTRDKYINSVFICILLLIMLGVGFVAYSFYQSISGNKQYNIGSGNRYMNILQNTIHGEKVDEEEDNSLNLMKIQEQNKQIIQSSIESLSKQRISEEDSFLKRFPVSTEMEFNTYSDVIEPELIPCVVFTAFSNPVFHLFLFYLLDKYNWSKISRN